MANQWFKFYGGEYLSDSKIGRLTASERSCWLTLLCMASMTENGVIEFLSIEDLLTKSGIIWNPYNEGEWERCQSVLTKFSSMKMIKADTEKSSIEIINWIKRQERTAQTPYERVKKYRENKRNIANDNKIDNADNKIDNDRIEENRIEENRIEENRINNTEKNKKFIKPTEEEVRSYCSERKNKVDASKFLNFYDSKGWKIGKNPMKDWKACVRTWEQNETSNTPSNVLRTSESSDIIKKIKVYS